MGGGGGQGQVLDQAGFDELYYLINPDRKPKPAAPAPAPLPYVPPPPPAPAPAAPAAFVPDPGPPLATAPTGTPIGTGGGIAGPSAAGNSAGGLGDALGGSVLKPPQYWVGGINQYGTPSQNTGRTEGAVKTSNKE